MKALNLMIIGLLISGMSFLQTTVKKVTVIIILLLFSTIINSQSLDNERVRSISQIWASAHNLNSEIANIICKTVDDEPLLYIINFKKGWVMISADESLKPVLGFSFDTNYSEENEPDAIKSLFEFYRFVKNKNRANNIEFATEWGSIESNNLRNTNDTEEVEPLIPVLWDQDWPYNAYCPLDDDMPNNYNGHHQTSCGPTAFAQILRYWAYPVHGTGYHSYTYDDLGFVEADFGSTYYNWNNMPVSLDFDDPEPVYTDVATLMLHAGVSVDGAYSSGGGLSQYSSAAVKYFGYSPICEVLYRDDFTNTEWHTVFRNDLDSGRPIMLSGNSEGSAAPWENGVHYGHYFVCDGYYGDDFYHINWGWEGSGNGYFPLFALGDYIYHNDALIGHEPNYENKELVLNDPYTVDDNTVVLLHFDGNFTNQSTLTNDPVAHGTTAFTDNSAMGLGQCLYLDNSNQGNQSFLDIVDNNNLDLSNDWTIEMWFNPTSFGNDWYEKFTLLNKPGDDENFESNYSAYILPTTAWDSKSLLCSYFPTEQVDSNPACIYTDRDFLELGEWYHFTFIRNTTEKTLKLVIHNSDGELIHYASSPYCNEVASQPLLNSNPLFIGSSNESNTYFDGYIDELRISNVVREFEITSTELTLLVPDGGECWQSGTTQQISWSCVNIENLKLVYSTDNGESWELINNSFDATLGQYDWLIPNVVSEQCLVKITDASNENTYRISSSAFQIYDQSTLNLIAPNGGEYFQCESIIPIIWEMSGINEVDIYYSTDNGGNWTQIVAGYSANNQPYLWTVPNVTSSNCKIKIEGNTISNESAGTFVIVNSEIPGGPFAVDDNTVLLLSLDNSLVNKSELSSNAIANGDYSFSTNTLLGMGYCIDIAEGSYLSVPHNDNLSLQDDWTIEMWFNINSLNAVLINKPTVSWESNYNIHVEAPDGHMEARFYDLNSNRYQISTPTGTIEPNEWYHVTFINDASNNFIELIVRHEDFSVEFQQSLSYPSGTLPAISENDVVIGDDVDGYIDEVRISDVVRSFENVLYAGFSADVTSGNAPLTVNFTDLSTGNPTSWEWDFENDGTIDSYVQNPEWIYYEPGTYTVLLNVSDGTNTDTEIKTDFITVFILPGEPSNPGPEDGATGISIYTNLSWVNGNSTETIDLYFDTNNPPENLALNNVPSVTSFDPGDLNTETTYYWQVICKNSIGSTEGQVWSFTTELETGIFNNQIINDLFIIYPNPSKKNVFINSPKAVNLSIYSLTGQKIWEQKNFLNGVIDVSGFKKGIYLVVFMDEKYMVSRKLIIE